jgi:hypothetical protein
MKWYWILLIVCGIQGLFLLVWWLLNRNKGSSPNTKLEASTATRLEEELAAEKKKGETIAAANQAMVTKIKAIAIWYTENRDKISKEASSEFKAMAGDSDSIDSWLDDALGRNDPTNPETETE